LADTSALSPTYLFCQYISIADIFLASDQIALFFAEIQLLGYGERPI
jgi:hypothetical protein